MIFIDTETTGFIKPDATNLAHQPFITEIYACKVDENFDFVSEYETFLNIPIPVPELITQITGINDEMLVNAPIFAQAFNKLAQFFIGENEVVGHNIEFDLGVIRFELQRIGKEFHFPWPMIHTCTVEKSMFIKNRRLKLGQLHEMATGKPHEGAHRAKADVMALIRSYLWLRKRW